MKIYKLLRRLRESVGGVVRRAVRLLQRREVPRLLEAFNRGLALGRKHDVPARKDAHHYADDAAEDAEHDEVDRQQGVKLLDLFLNDLGPHPRGADGEGVQTQDSSVYEEEEEGFVVPETEAGR